MTSAQYGTEFTHAQYQNIQEGLQYLGMYGSTRGTTLQYHPIPAGRKNLIGSVQEQSRDYDLLSMVMLCLGGADGENYDGILKLLDVLLSSEAGEAEKKQILQNEFDVPMTQTLESEVQAMCNLSQNVEERGRTEGKAEERLSAIRNLMASMAGQ